MYQEGYRTAIAKLGALCVETGDALPCSMSEDEVGDALSGFWASGMWSDLIRYSQAAAIPGDLLSGTGVAATVTLGPIDPAIWLVYGADTTGELRIARISDPYGGGPYESVAVRPFGLPSGITDRDPGIAAHSDGLLYVAYREAGSQLLRIASAGLTGTFIHDPRWPAIRIDGSPGLASVGATIFVAVRNADSRAIEVLSLSGGTVSSTTISDADIAEVEPFLVETHVGLMLLTVYGPTPIRDPVTGDETAGPEGGPGRTTYVVRSRVLLPSGDFSFYATLKRLPLTHGLEPHPSGDEEPIGTPLFTEIDQVGPSAVLFGNRVHTFLPTIPSTELSPGTTSTLSFVPAIATGSAPTSESRIRGLTVGGVNRVAPVVFRDPRHGDVLFVFGASNGGSINGRFRQSH
jgi:hypothetical protein